MFAALACYVMWGLFPAFFPLLLPAGPVEILAHRIVWTAAFMLIVLILSGRWLELREASAKQWTYMALASLLVTGNWGIYVIAVNSRHVADAALGYFINPLFSIVLAMFFLNEVLSRRQRSAVIIAAIGVLQLALLSEQAPIHAIGLAFTFGLYGLIKKKIELSSIASVCAEAMIMSLIALGYLWWLESTGNSTFGHVSPTHTGLMIASGIITAAPLLLFGIGAKQLPLATIGMLQYITPTMQMFWALFVTQEHFTTARWIGYTIIWIAVAIYLSDLLSTLRRRRIDRPYSESPPDSVRSQHLNGGDGPIQSA